MLVTGDFNISFWLYEVKNYVYVIDDKVTINSATSRTVLDRSKLSIPKVNAP